VIGALRRHREHKGSGFVDNPPQRQEVSARRVDVAGSVGDNVYAVYDGINTKVVPDEDGNDGGIRVGFHLARRESA
jgi:hypothetical protein